MQCNPVRASPQGFVGKDGVGERGKAAWPCLALLQNVPGTEGCWLLGSLLSEVWRKLSPLPRLWLGSGWHSGCWEDVWISREAHRAAQGLFKSAGDSEQPPPQRRGTVLPHRILWDSPGPPEPPLLLSWLGLHSRLTCPFARLWACGAGRCLVLPRWHSLWDRCVVHGSSLCTGPGDLKGGASEEVLARGFGDMQLPPVMCPDSQHLTHEMPSGVKDSS